MNKKKIIREARSKRNGIVLYSNNNPFICYEVYINEKGEIEKEKISRELSEMRDEDAYEAPVKMEKIEKKIKIAILIVGVISIIVTQKPTIGIGLLYFSMLALKELLQFTEAAYEMKCGKKQDIARFHAAEHMLLNSYRKLQRIPTCEEIKKPHALTVSVAVESI